MSDENFIANENINSRKNEAAFFDKPTECVARWDSKFKMMIEL